jgi:cell division protein FtsL
MTRYVHKQIHNAPLYKPSDRRAVRRLLLILVLITMVAGSLIYATWQHVEALRLGYQTDHLVRERDRREAEKRQLELERAYQRSPHVIEELARRLGMIRPDSSKVIVVGGKPRAAVSDAAVPPRPLTASHPTPMTLAPPMVKTERIGESSAGPKLRKFPSPAPAPASAEMPSVTADSHPRDETKSSEAAREPGQLLTSADERERRLSSTEAEGHPPTRKRPSKQGDPR